ncbi:MAG TPA: hypothetical protein VFT16_00650 [Candidatus Saccharimonadales bacterium]|nr:hypothetical protein [Candidatus Saccharimonadales bacterium]
MLKRGFAAWAAFWIGVVLALIAWAAFSFKAGLLVFAVGLLATIILVGLAVRSGAINARRFLDDLDERPGRSESDFGFGSRHRNTEL